LLKHILCQSPDYQLTGLEYNQAGLRYLQQLQQQHPNLSISNGNVNKLPFNDKSFDAITLNDVLYHTNIQPHDCLSECLRVLKPKGHLLVNVAAYNWMTSTHDKQVHTRERYTTTKLRQQLLQAGFIVQKASYWNSLLFPLMALHRLTAGKIKQSSDVETLPDWQDKLFYRMIRAEQSLQQHGIFIPFGGSAWAWASKP